MVLLCTNTVVNSILAQEAFCHYTFMVIIIYRVADFLIFIFHILKCYYSTLKYYYIAGNNFFPVEIPCL